MAVVIGFGGGGVITGNDNAISVNTTLDTTKNWALWDQLQFKMESQSL